MVTGLGRLVTATPTRRKREVWYTLGATRTRLDDPNVVIVPISTHARFVDAYKDSLAWHGVGGWTRIIQRHTNPVVA